MKRYHGPIPVASNVQTRKTTHIAGHQTPRVPDFDHSQCGQPFIPYSFVPRITSPSPGIRPTSPLPSPNPITDHFPNCSSSATTPPPLPSARRRSLPLPTRSFDHERHNPSPVSVEPRSSSSPRKLQSPTRSPKNTTFVQSPSRLNSLINGASRNLRQRLYSSPQSNSPSIFRASLNKSFDTLTLLLPLTLRSHPDLYVVIPNSNVKRNHYSKSSFLETSQNFCLLRRSHAPKGNCSFTNNL